MPQVAKPVIKQRAAQLRELGDRLLTTYLNSQTGRTFETLMEKPTFGRTEQFTEILIEDINAEPGVLMQAKVIGHDGRRLVGEAVV